MGEWQELSGFVRSKQRREQNDFWKELRAAARAATHTNLNLDDDERLCAIALVKRFFPDVAKTVTGRDIAAAAWLSTVDIAAAPWRKKIAAAATEKPEVAGLLREFTEFDSARAGNYLNRTALENEGDTPLCPDSRHNRRELLGALEKLEAATGDRAGNFYAILLMDGDHMGKLIREHGAANVTTALTAFSAGTPAIVERHGGECVYAGGDDLLALLPLDKALACAAAVRERYVSTFAAKLPAAAADAAATISAAIVFAHYHVAFRRVLHHAHQRLDNDAKDGAKRDAIALSVLKPGGETCRWVAKFYHFLTTKSATTAAENRFAPLIEKFRDDTNDDVNDGSGTGTGAGGITLSSKFLYNLRSRFADFSGTRGDFVRLFTAELVHGRLAKDPAKSAKQRDDATALMGKLTDLCTNCLPAATASPATTEPPKPTLNFDGARLVRFLALDGKEGNE
jgi:CRISPR-associated protein Cmr2